MKGEISRREFAVAAAATLATRFRAFSPVAPRRMVAQLILGSAASARQGAATGREEALRAEMLLRAPLDLPMHEAATSAEARNLWHDLQHPECLAVVVSGEESLGVSLPPARPDGPVLISTLPDARDPLAFALAPTVADRAAALADWRDRARGELPPGNVAAVAWTSALAINGADSLNQRFRAAYPQPPDEPEWLAWFAIKYVTEAALRSGATTRRQLRAAIERGGSDGHKGVMLRFDPQRRLVQPLYVVTPANGAGDARVLHTWTGASREQLPGTSR